MRKLILLCLTGLLSWSHGVEVQDQQRECPYGFFYAGEVEIPVTRGEVWSKGETSPIYSCYSIQNEEMDWVTANQRCFENKGQLLSVNNFQEEDILTGEMFLEQLHSNSTTATNGVLTSGISLTAGDWTWFGAGEKVSNDDIIEMVNEGNDTISDDTLCLLISWENDNKNLSYSAAPCANSAPTAVCEVRVFTQTWYVWFTTNWLQILFLFTLVLLIISSCVTVQIYSSRPRRPRGQAEPSSMPPPYTPHDVTMTKTNKTPNKYAEKGKELLAKVVFYRQPEDKEKLTTNA